MISERDIVARLAADFPSPDGIGDDAAILRLGDDCLVIAKDLLAEDVHFRRHYFSPVDLAHKALEVNLSDIAAMGAVPHKVLLGLSLPADLDPIWISQFLAAFTERCRARGVTLIGGDTTAANGKIFISITALGLVPEPRLKRRSGAHAGDVICVAGNLGYADLGLHGLESGTDTLAAFADALRRPVARLAEGEWLGWQQGVTAMMDISDGLFVDLGRLCAASGVGAAVNCTEFPTDPTFKEFCALLGRDALRTQLEGGEDYGLLFTIEPASTAALVSSFAARFGYPLLIAGEIVTGAGVTLLNAGQPLDLTLLPFSHFGEAP